MSTPTVARMSAAKAARKPRTATPKPVGEAMSTEDAARRIALLDSPGYLDVNRARAALWLLDQIDGDHLSFYSRDSMSAEDLEGWVRGIVKDAIGASLAAAEQKITEAVKGKAVA